MALRLNLLLLLFFPCSGFAQTVQLSQLGPAELNDMVIVDGRIYAAGSIIESPRFIPFLACMTLKGDTIWTRRYPELSKMGKFEKILFLEDSLCVIGNGKVENSYSDYYSFIARITLNGKFVSRGFNYTATLTDVVATGKTVWFTGKSEQAYGHLFLMCSDYRLKAARAKMYTPVNPERGSGKVYSGNGAVSCNGMLWVGGSYSMEGGTAFSITRFSETMDSIGSTYLFPKGGECQQILKDRSDRIWAAGPATTGPHQRGLGVACLDDKGDTLLTACHDISDHSSNASDMIQAENGDLMIWSIVKNVPVLHVYRGLQLVRTVTLDAYKDHRVQKVIEYRPGKFVILCLQLVGPFYGRSALIYWEMPK